MKVLNERLALVFDDLLDHSAAGVVLQEREGDTSHVVAEAKFER